MISAPAETRLLEAEVTIKSTEECRRNITSTNTLRNAVIDNKVVCASSPGKDSCQVELYYFFLLFILIKEK